MKQPSDFHMISMIDSLDKDVDFREKAEFTEESLIVVLLKYIARKLKIMIIFILPWWG